MDIRELDVRDDVALRAYYDLDSRAELLGREDLPHWTWPEMSSMFQTPDPGERHVTLGGYVDDRLVGAATIYLPLLDNTDKAWLSVHVDPPMQHRGYGAALLHGIVNIGRSEGRTTQVLETKIPFDHVTDHGYRRFAESHGFRFSNIEVVRLLDLPVPPLDLQRWAAEAAAKHRDYRIEVFTDIPEVHLPSYFTLWGQLAVDAPTGEVDWEEEKMTFERHQSRNEYLAAAGRTAYDALAFAPDGEVAAFTTLVVTKGRDEVSQWGTFVHRGHRGHRLGLAVKVANLQHLQRHHPGMRRVHTQNAETNQWMIAVNEQVGFEPVEASMELVLELD